MSPADLTLTLDELAVGAQATVCTVAASAPIIDANALQRLAELGFIAGEPVELVRRGPGGREPLAVLIGTTLIGLRLAEARCVRVTLTCLPAISGP